MVTRKKMATTAAATFGAAIATIYTAPELNADIVGLTFSPGSIAAGATGSFVAINEVAASFRVWNTSFSPGVTSFSFSQFSGGLTQVQYSQTLSAGTFAAASGINYLTNPGGVNYIGFSTNGNVGWFQIDLTGGNMVFGPGEYGNAGESVHVGGTSTGIPEPTAAGALALLAMGATGIRRRRKQVA